jgi:hypothetical protein
MNITIHPTSKIVDLQSEGGTVPARVWEGTTDTGIPVHCFITRIAPTIPVHDSRQKEFQDALQEVEAPSAGVVSYPLRLIL